MLIKISKGSLLVGLVLRKLRRVLILIVLKLFLLKLPNRLLTPEIFWRYWMLFIFWLGLLRLRCWHSFSSFILFYLQYFKWDSQLMYIGYKRGKNMVCYHFYNKLSILLLKKFVNWLAKNGLNGKKLSRRDKFWQNLWKYNIYMKELVFYNELKDFYLKISICVD